MSGPRINDQQVKIYMKARNKGRTQVIAAARAGFSERSARNLRKRQMKNRSWRTKPDPFEEVWEREKVGSAAEVDYLVRIGAKIIPIEVKAGSTGRLKSLKQLMASKGIPRGVRISERPFEWEGNILSLPFYYVAKLSGFLQTSTK